ncbi:MAG: nucleotidyltransferase domain-containing protein [Bacteroidales bacterium]|jgi:HTH-type transcriptional regulator, competence development regulator
MSLVSFGMMMRGLRERSGLSLRQTARLSEIDIALLSKMERGERKFARKHIAALASIYNADPDNLIIQFLADKIQYELKDEKNAENVIQLAEKSILYGKWVKTTVKDIILLSEKVFREDKRIEKVWIFGSFSRNEQSPGSDIDIMLRVRNGYILSLYDLSELQYQLEKALSMKVDVVDERALSPLVLDSVMQDRVIIYG